jgi:hypothetical protein
MELVLRQRDWARIGRLADRNLAELRYAIPLDNLFYHFLAELRSAI